MIAVLHQSQHHVIAGEPRHQSFGMLPRHVGVGDACDDVVVALVKDGDHRLSRPEDVEQLIGAVAEF